jgi:hypothetical protein
MSGMGRAVAAILLAGAVAGAAAFAHLLASEPTLPAFGASALPSAPGSPLVVQAAPWAPPQHSAVSTHPGQLAVGPPARTIVITRIKAPATATHPARVQPAHVAAGVSSTPAAIRPRSTKPTPTKPAPAPVASAPAPAAAPVAVATPAPVIPAPTDRGLAQTPAVAPNEGKHQGDGEQHHGQGNEDKHGGDHGGNNGNNGSKGDDKSSTVLAAVQVVSPTPPQVVAPTPPQVVAPQAPQVVAPQAPQVVAPQLPFIGGTGDKHGHGDAGGDDSH